MRASLFRKCHVLTPPNNWVLCSCCLTLFPHWNKENSKKEVKIVGWKKNLNNINNDDDDDNNNKNSNKEKGKKRGIKPKKDFFGQTVLVAQHLHSKELFPISNLNLTLNVAVLKKEWDTNSHISQIPLDYQFHLILVFPSSSCDSLSHS